MIQFNLNRFGKLARWSLTNDKKYHVKTFFQTLVIMTLLFLFLTSITITYGKDNANYHACAIGTVILFVSTFVLGSSFMFYSMDGKHDMQALLMLPASNFEKYLMRYASWILLIPLYIVATVAADLVQYVFGLVVGHEEVRFVAPATMELLGNAWAKVLAEKHHIFVIGMVLLFFWLQSVYALGATFFRSKKYNWIPTTAVVIVLFLLLVWLSQDGEGIDLVKDDSALDMVVNMAYVAWVALNFWLSYRLFCRQQVIGKYVNV
ncbi:MAG: hypothetical protein IJJ56_07255 [Prevotella sp.]|nr:hypothetical protein [Prevotella sp.]